MSLDIYFVKDVTDRLLALHQANERALTLAQRYGMDAEAADLCWRVYTGALADVAISFGLAALAIPKREEVTQRGPMRGALVSDDRRLAETARGAARGADRFGRGPG